MPGYVRKPSISLPTWRKICPKECIGYSRAISLYSSLIAFILCLILTQSSSLSVSLSLFLTVPPVECSCYSRQAGPLLLYLHLLRLLWKASPSASRGVRGQREWERERFVLLPFVSRGTGCMRPGLLWLWARSCELHAHITVAARCTLHNAWAPRRGTRHRITFIKS